MMPIMIFPSISYKTSRFAMPSSGVDASHKTDIASGNLSKSAGEHRFIQRAVIASSALATSS